MVKPCSTGRKRAGLLSSHSWGSISRSRKLVWNGAPEVFNIFLPVIPIHSRHTTSAASRWCRGWSRLAPYERDALLSHCRNSLLSPGGERQGHCSSHTAGFVNLLRLKFSSGTWVSHPSPSSPLGSPLCVCNCDSTLESCPQLLAVVRRRQQMPSGSEWNVNLRRLYERTDKPEPCIIRLHCEGRIDDEHQNTCHG